MLRKIFWIFFLTTILFKPCFAWGETKTLRIPLTLDYPLIRSFFNYQAFNQPGGKAYIGDFQKGGCNRIELGGIEVSAEQSLLKINSNIKINLGLKLLRTCTPLVSWEGKIKVLQKIWIDKTTRQLRFTTVSSQILNQEEQPTKIGNKFMEVIKNTVIPFFNELSINLDFPVEELKTILPLLATPETRFAIEKALNTLRFDEVRIDKDALRLSLLMEIEFLPQPELPKTSEELSPHEIEVFARSWETWDSFLVYQLESLLGKPLTESDQLNLFETLYETRQKFIQALTEKNFDRNFIREQFIWAWQRLAGTLRTYLAAQPSSSLLRYLAFFTATDAFSVLDQLGPQFGLEVSREGLLRLAHLLAKEGEEEPLLEYSYAVDPKLRTLLGLGAPLDETGPAFDLLEIEIPETSPSPFSFLKLLPSVAFATEGKADYLSEIAQWLFTGKNLPVYINQVKQVLEQAAEETWAKNTREESYKDFYSNLVLATAWQESCWRQFVKAKGKVRYLLSYNQSSIGLMQVNERVWRGFYRPESLRWNIHYNARAGSEILDYYLRKYALKKMGDQNPVDFDLLARLVYAMYNGGPGEFNKFLKRKAANSFYKSDMLFWEKYSCVKSGQFEELSQCLLEK